MLTWVGQALPVKDQAFPSRAQSLTDLLLREPGYVLANQNSTFQLKPNMFYVNLCIPMVFKEGPWLERTKSKLLSYFGVSVAASFPGENIHALLQSFGLKEGGRLSYRLYHL